MNIAIDIILFLIIIAIIVILTWGGITDWTFKSQSYISGAPKPFNIVILPTKSPQTPPPQTPPPQTPPPQTTCPPNTLTQEQLFPGNCYGFKAVTPPCQYYQDDKLAQIRDKSDCLNLNSTKILPGKMNYIWNPCPKNTYQYGPKNHDLQNVPNGCYAQTDIFPCSLTTGAMSPGGKLLKDYSYNECEEARINSLNDPDWGGRWIINWKGPSPSPTPSPHHHHHHHHKKYSCVPDPSILGGKCVHDPRGRHTSLSDCQRNCGPAPQPQKRYSCKKQREILGGKCVHDPNGRYYSLSDCERNCGPAPAPGPGPGPGTGCCCSSDGMVTCNESGNNSCGDDSDCPGEYCIISGGLAGAQHGCGSVSNQPRAVQPGQPRQPRQPGQPRQPRQPGQPRQPVQPGAHRMGFSQEYFNTSSQVKICSDNFGRGQSRIKLHIPDYYY